MANPCPSCQADNATDARQCSSCGTKLRRARRRNGDNGDPTQVQISNLGNNMTLFAFRVAALGLIPLFGLILGPIAFVLALVAYRREKAGPRPKGLSPALAVLTLAVAVGISNWVGVALMVYGLTRASP